jgi:hypothetical protein
MRWSWSREEVMMRHVQLFDVHETLLDLAAMDPHFQRIFGEADGYARTNHGIPSASLWVTTRGWGR